MQERIQTHYLNHYKLDTTFLVAAETIARTVAETLGIRPSPLKIEDASGVVFKLNKSYSGFFDRALWDWLSQAEAQPA